MAPLRVAKCSKVILEYSDENRMKNEDLKVHISEMKSTLKYKIKYEKKVFSLFFSLFTGWCTFM